MGVFSLYRKKLRSNRVVYKLVLDNSFINSHNTWTEGTLLLLKLAEIQVQTWKKQHFFLQCVMDLCYSVL